MHTTNKVLIAAGCAGLLSMAGIAQAQQTPPPTTATHTVTTNATHKVQPDATHKVQPGATQQSQPSTTQTPAPPRPRTAETRLDLKPGRK